MEAAKRFDPERNVKFISYAVWWVRQAIFHALSEHTRVFRLPAEALGPGLEGRQRAPAAGGRAGARRPPPRSWPRRPSSPTQEVEDAAARSRATTSRSRRAVGEDGSLELGDTLEQDTIPSVELELIRSSFEEQIRALVAELDEKEREVISMRFGLDGEEPRTLQEIGEALGLSRERIRQIESKAKEKLRRSNRAQGLRGALN